MKHYHELLAQYRPSQTEYESYDGVSRHHIAVLALFDHDWEQHLLVQQCSTGVLADALGLDEWEYALYLVTSSGAIHVHTFFDAERIPWVEAATLVQCWSRNGHYDGMSNDFESDTFD